MTLDRQDEIKQDVIDELQEAIKHLEKAYLYSNLAWNINETIDGTIMVIEKVEKELKEM